MSPELQPEVAGEPSPAGALAPAHAMVSGARARETLAFKFGGSSLSGADRILHAARLVREAASDASVVVVVSAMKGVTDNLLAIAAALEGGRGEQALRAAEHLLYVHFDVLRELRLDPFAAELECQGFAGSSTRHHRVRRGQRSGRAGFSRDLRL